MTQREKKIAVGVAAVAVLAAIYAWVISPWLDTRQTMSDDLQTLQTQYDGEKNLLVQQRILRPVWAQLKSSGLFDNDTDAESQVLHASVNWAISSGLQVTALTSPHSLKNGEFQVISFEMEVTGRMRDVDKLLWSLENSTVPLRVTDIEIDAPKEGVDSLKASIGISTLSWKTPPPPATPQQTPEQSKEPS